MLIQKTADGVELFRSFLDDFFDIFEACIREESTPLLPAILPLIFIKYPAQGLRDILYYRSRYELSYALIACGKFNWGVHISVLDIVTTADLASIRHSVNASPQSLAVAAEAVLEYLINEVKLDFPPTCSEHKTWLQRKKPRKCIATGAPKLSSVFYARCVSSLMRLVEQFDHEPRHRRIKSYNQLHTLYRILGPKYRFLPHGPWYRRDKLRMVVSLLNALLRVLPKAGFSEKIISYSRRTILLQMYLHEPGLCRRVRRCIEKYTIRVQSTKLEELGHGIENGKCVVCLISV